MGERRCRHAARLLAPCDLRLWWLHGVERLHLAHSVEAVEAQSARLGFLGDALQRGVECGIARPLQRREGPVARHRIEQSGVHVVTAEHRGRPMSCDQVRDLVDLVGFHQDARPTRSQRGHRLVEAVDAAQRKDRERECVGCGEAEDPGDLLGVAGDRTLAVQHELRRTGRTRGRKDVAGRACLGVVGAMARSRQESIEGHTPQALDGGRHRRGLLADGHYGCQPVERVRLDVGQDRQEVDAAEARRADQYLGARTADDIGDLDGAIARIDGDGDGAESDAGEIDDGVSRHVGQP
jgi:hypothetical protein